MKLKINEIYYSIQGESSYMGRPCIFIRLTYCNLRCTYCDSEYTFHEGNDMSIDDIIDKIKKYPCKLVEVTGGEPLFQKNCINLLEKLVDLKYDVLLETNSICGGLQHFHSSRNCNFLTDKIFTKIIYFAV